MKICRKSKNSLSTQGTESWEGEEQTRKTAKPVLAEQGTCRRGYKRLDQPFQGLEGTIKKAYLCPTAQGNLIYFCIFDFKFLF